MMPCPATSFARIRARAHGGATSLACGALLFLVLSLAAASSAVQGSLSDPAGNSIAALTAGSRFTLRVHGDSVALNDRVRIVSSTTSCSSSSFGLSGTNTPLVRWPFDGVPVVNYTEGELEEADGNGTVPHSSDPAPAEGTLLLWTDLAVLQTGGYQVCYCDAAAAEGQCDSDAEFGVQVFSFNVQGPSASQTFTCHAGWACEVGPVTGDVIVGSQLRVMNKCYPPERTAGFLPGSGAEINETDIASDPTVSLDSVGIDRMFSWGTERILGPGHVYELCWCSGGSCNQTEDFLARAGTLVVPGPARVMEVLWSSAGQTWHFAIEQGIDLGNGDRVMVLDECSGAANMSTSGLPYDGVMPPATNDGHDFIMSADTSNSTVVTVGSYRLCWCHRTKECLDSSDFRHDIGTVTVAGPTGGQSWVCTMGHSCTLSGIAGVTLAVDDYYIAAENCGVSGHATGFRSGQVLSGTLDPMPSKNSTSASFRWTQVRATTGSYQVCWASAWQKPSSQSCSELGWNDTAGSAATCAETSLDAGCSQVSASSAASSCTARGARLCLPHEIVQGETLGTDCSARDRLTWTSQSCGEDHVVIAKVDQGEAGSTCESRRYQVTPWQSADQLHWGACCADTMSTNSSLTEYFTDVSNFRASAGTVTIYGPFLSDEYCVMGDPCTVTIEGLGVNGGYDRLQIVHHNATCDDPHAVLASLDFEHPLANGTAVTSYEETFYLGKSSSFAAFWMCWCSIGNGVSCTNRNEFFNTAGELLVGGINEQTVVCIFSQPCVLHLSGTNLGAEDSILVAQPGGKCGNAFPLSESLINPATTTNATDKNKKTFDLGNIMLHGDFRICYCIQFGTRVCFAPGPVLERFSLTAGFVKVYGPFFNATPAAARAGVAYALEISGRQLSLLNRVTVQHRSQGPACGEEGSDLNHAAVTVPTSEPTSVSTDGSQQVWDGVTVLRAGDYRVCWCRGHDDSTCATSSSYSMQVAFLVVNGIWESVLLEPKIAGNPFLLSLNGRQLSSSDRVVFVSKSQVARCGDTGTMRYAEQAKNSQGAPLVEDQYSVERWRNVVVMNVGEYFVCWCGHGICDLDQKFGVEAAQLTVTGPDVTKFQEETAGEYFQLSLSGVALSPLDRISIVDASVECGQALADDLASTVVVAHPVINSTRVSAQVLGPPAYSNVTQQAWGGLMIRWQGTYKVCWGGEHDSSGPCVGPTWKNCSVTESAHHPFHVGDLRVVYGSASVVGQSYAVRCDSLDLNAFSPTPPSLGFSALDALAAEWACAPCGEFCGSLEQHLSDLGSGSLHLHIPEDVIANSLDRARWVAAGYAQEFTEEQFTLSVTMTDTHNVTRWGALPIVVSTLKPLVYGWPSKVNITLNEELHLEVYTNFPGGIVCGGVMEAGPPAVNATWSITPSSDSTSLHLTPAEVASLGTGTHNISARVEFGDAFATQEVFFIVQISSPPLPSVVLRGPERASTTCPVAVDASTAADSLFAAAALSYQWYSGCTGVQSSDCSGGQLASNSAPVQVFLAGALQAGENLLGANIGTADGRGLFSTVSVMLGSGGTWPFTPAPLPPTVPHGSQVHCAVTTAAANTGSCAAPAGTIWAVRDLSDNATSQLTTEQISIASGANSGLRLQAAVPASMLQTGGQYRCILREGSTDVYISDVFTVASPPTGGRVIVAPSSGIALQTRFTSTSVGWATDYLPLEHMFMVLPSGMMALNETDPVDAANLLQGWSSDMSVGYVTGMSGQLRMVARVRDSLGAAAQAMTDFQAQVPSASDILAGKISTAAQWPPGARSLLTSAAAFVDAALSTGVNSSSLVSHLLDNLWASTQLSSSTELGSEDLALRSWVLEQTLLFTTSELSVNHCTEAARILETSASQAAAQALAATQTPIDAPTTQRLLNSASLILEVADAANADDSLQVKTETLRALRTFGQDLGLALRARLRRSSWLSDVTAAEFEEVSAADMSVLTGRVLRASVANGINLPAYGLQMSIPSLANSRRLSGTSSESTILADTCHSQHTEIQLMHWERNPMDAAPWDQQVRFEAAMSDMVATWPSGYGLSHPHVAGVRLWLCPEGLQRFPGISVQFDIGGGVHTPGSVQQVRNGSLLLTYHINVSWVCAQWDSTLGLWRANPAMLAEVKASSIRCVSTLDAKQNDDVWLAAFPGALTTLQSERPVDPVETEEAGVEFDATPLMFLVIAALAVEIPLIVFVALDIRDRTSSKASAEEEDPYYEMSVAPSCMLVPGVSCSEGLSLLRPLRCCAWPCGQRLRRKSDVIPIDADKANPLPIPVVADSKPAFETQPALREDALAAARAGHDIVQNLYAEKWNNANFRMSAGSCTLHDHQQAYKRDMLMASIAGYRRLLIASDRVQESMKGAQGDQKSKSGGVECGVDVCLQSGVSREDEAFVLRVAHHVQTWLENVGDSNEGLKLTVEEEFSLKCTQRALGDSFARARSSIAPSGKLDVGSSESQGAPHAGDPKIGRPQPFFAPVNAIRLVLLSIENAVGSRAPTPKTPKSDTDKPLNLGTGNFSGVVPESQTTVTSAWADIDGVVTTNPNAMSQSGKGGQPYLPGCSYFLWAYEKMLFVHRAETLQQYRELPAQPLDEALSRHESTRCYNLERDVEDITVDGNDDRHVIVSIRRGPVLRWSIDGEIRPWIENLRRTVPPSVDTALDPVDLVHGACRDPWSFFLYNYEEPPHTASNVHLESVMGYTEPCIMWPSHGGTALSFAFWPNRDQIQASAIEDVEGTGAAPLGTVVAAEGAPPVQQQLSGKERSKKRAIALYVSGIEILNEELRDNTIDGSPHRFCLEIKQTDGVILRLCFNSRFMRMACRTNLLRLRFLLYPGIKPILLFNRPTQGGQRNSAVGFGNPTVEMHPGTALQLTGSSSPATTPLGTSSRHGDTPRQPAKAWTGFYGYLELKILSACGLGLSVPAGMDAAKGSVAILGKGDKASQVAKAALPVPKLCAYLPTQPPPKCTECRKTPDLPERTANPVWQCTWHFRVEYSPEEDPPAEIRLEVWNVDGRNEFLGEVIVPFPLEPGLQQYHCALEANPGKMKDADRWKVPSGSISFQTRLKSDRIPRMPEMLRVPPHLMQALCGVFGVEIVGGVGLKSADFLTSDPYCVVLVNTAPRQVCSWRSSTKFGTLNPVWRELHEFRLNWPNSELSTATEVKIEVWDHDLVSSDEFLGEIAFPMPTGNGENMLDLELQGNRLKGASNVKGRLRARVYFRDQFTEAAVDNDDGPLELYESWFTEYFGARDVDEQLARAMAAPLIFFHFSNRRLFFSHLWDAWRRATHELVSKSGRGGKGLAHCYLELTSALWFALAVAACVRALLTNYIGAAVGGFIGGAFAPNLAHILHEFVWHRPLMPVSGEKHNMPVHSPDDAPVFALSAILMSLLIIGVCVGFTSEDEADIQTLVSAAIVLVTRLLIVPLWQACYYTFLLSTAKRSRMFDGQLRRNPSIITASGALLKGLPLHTLVPTAS